MGADRPRRPGDERLKKRRQFLALNGGARGFGSALVLQARPRDYPGAGEAEGPRFGFTVTKKVGNAVVRNRIRRRLKAAVAELPQDGLRADHDYVVIAKRPALTAPYDTLAAELRRVLAQAHRKGSEAHRKSRSGGDKRGRSVTTHEPSSDPATPMAPERCDTTRR